MPSTTHARRGAAAGAAGGDEDLGLAGDQVRDGEGVPGAAAPPQGVRAHDGEAERDGREGVGHEDGVVRAEDEVALPVQHVQSGTDVSFGDAEPVGQVGGRGCPAGAGERVVHGHPEVFGAGRVGDHVGISSSS
ncbi:hypothetical protein ACU686_02610 [Yinghuangia aomiensis]